MNKSPFHKQKKVIAQVVYIEMEDEALYDIVYII